MPTAGVTSASDLISGYFFFSASSTATALGLGLPEKLKVWMKCTFSALGPASSVKRPPEGPQCETIGTFQPMRSSDFTTCADGATLATSSSTSLPACLRRLNCGTTSTSLVSNFSMPTYGTPLAASAALRPFSFDSPQGLLIRIRPGFLVPYFLTA